MTYKPLPKKLYIQNSKIHGQGLFTDKKIKPEVVLGLSHIKIPNSSFDNELIRTPLGGFINHSDEPNCELIESEVAFYLVTKSSLKRGDELTVKYRWYNPKD
tara:strand:- start:505 stop:810 length:306 start_codon:yes stop_codon:yes gene_type:complete